MQYVAKSGFIWTSLLVVCISTSSGCVAFKPHSGFKENRGDTNLSDALAHYSQGLILQIQGDHAGAAESYLQAIAGDPDYNDLYLHTAMSYIRQKKTDCAIDIIKQLCVRKHREEKPLLWLAFMYQAAGMNNESRDTYRKLIKLAPQKANGYFELATLYNRIGLLDEAILTLTEAQGRAEDLTDILPLLSHLYIIKASGTADETAAVKIREEAITILIHALKKDANNTSLLMQLG